MERAGDFKFRLLTSLGLTVARNLVLGALLRCKGKNQELQEKAREQEDQAEKAFLWVRGSGRAKAVRERAESRLMEGREDSLITELEELRGRTLLPSPLLSS